jgi:hypothetical protein
MSRHIPRHERWTKLGPNEYTSAAGVVRYELGAWWAFVAYQECDPEPATDALLEWHEHESRVGPFKRPRNAMMAVEEHALLLQRRLGDRIVIHAGGGRATRS